MKQEVGGLDRGSQPDSLLWASLWVLKTRSQPVLESLLTVGLVQDRN